MFEELPFFTTFAIFCQCIDEYPDKDNENN